MDHHLSEQVEIYLACRGLPNLDYLSHTDAFAVLSHQTRDGRWEEIARSETVYDTADPDFTHQFIVDFYFEEVQSMRVDIYDRDGKSEMLSKHDYCGQCNFTMGNLMGAQGQALSLSIEKNEKGKGKRKGKLYVRAETKSSSNDVLHVQFRGLKLDNKDGMFGKSDPFLQVSRVNEDGTFVVVWKSEVVMNNLSPTWKAHAIQVQRLCNGDLYRPIKIDVYDWDSDGTHDLIGSFQTSVQGLLDSAGSEWFECINEKKKKSGWRARVGKYKNSGKVQAANAVLENRPSFLEYIRGGVPINLMVAVDYTASNGNPCSTSSLHYQDRSGRLNSYEEAMLATGTILQEYDHDKRFPAYGFGGRLHSGEQANHCFPLSMNEGLVEVQGLQTLLGVYRNSFNFLSLSGPTLFAPLLSAVTSRVRANVEHARQNHSCPEYTVLLLLTDGVIMDMQQTVDAVVAASELPLSIVIVGVGGADFAAMERLDADDTVLTDSRGKRARRDVVQFVPFRDYKHQANGGSGAKLAADTLREIPDQLVGYMMSQGITPPAPLPRQLSYQVIPAHAQAAVGSVASAISAAGAFASAGAAGGRGGAGIPMAQPVHPPTAPSAPAVALQLGNQGRALLNAATQ